MRYELCLESKPLETAVSLLDGSKATIATARVSSVEQTEHLLSAIDSLLKRTGVAKEEVAMIVFRDREASLTSLRVAVTTANLLAFSWNIPVVSDDRKTGRADTFTKFIIPNYAMPPHITRPKK